MDTKISCVRWKRIIRNRANIKSCFFSLSLANPFFFFFKAKPTACKLAQAARSGNADAKAVCVFSES